MPSSVQQSVVVNQDAPNPNQVTGRLALWMPDGVTPINFDALASAIATAASVNATQATTIASHTTTIASQAAAITALTARVAALEA